MAVRVIISGDRNWFCPDLARRVVARLVARHGEVDIVHGNARGVDAAFADAAREAGCGVCSFAAAWDEHGKAAGPRRNQEMINEGAEFVIAVHRSLAWSRGTRDLVTRALAAGIPVYLIDSEEGEPRRLREIPERKEG
jgi:ABC-type sugar transport system substrate-binding protein